RASAALARARDRGAAAVVTHHRVDRLDDALQPDGSIDYSKLLTKGEDTGSVRPAKIASAGSPSDGPAGTPPAAGDVVGPSPAAGGPSSPRGGDPYYPPETPPPAVKPEGGGSWHGRELYDEELKDPGRRLRLFNRLDMEASGAPRQKKLETLETFLNRGVSRGMTVDEVIDDLNYFPGRIKNRRLSPEQLNEYEDLLTEARAGSNVAKYGTGNSGYDPKTKRWVGFNKGVMTVGSNDPRQDRIGIEGPDRGWSGQPDEPQVSLAQAGGQPGMNTPLAQS